MNTEPTAAHMLPHVPSEYMERIARKMDIVQLDGGATARWNVNGEQVAFWRAADTNLRRYVVKSRRIGISVAADIERCVQVSTWGKLGHKVTAAIFIDTEEKGKQRIAQCASFLQQMQIECTTQTYSISFPGGSKIDLVTVGGSNRGSGYQHATYEEFAFYGQGTFGEVSPTVSKGVRETIVTTIDVGAPNGRTAKELWYDKNSAFKKMFFSFQDHEIYRDTVSELTADEWDWAQKNGFTRKDSAAYWLREIVPNKCQNDVIRAFREYPPTEDKMFSSSDIMWVSKIPQIVDPVEVLRVQGIRGDSWPVLIYKKPSDAPLIMIAIDTAEGKNLDKTVVIGVDQTDWRPAFLLSSGKLMFDDAARVAFEMQQLYTPRSGVAPVVVIEEIGIGSATVATAATLGVVHEVHTPTEEGKYHQLMVSKMAVESGILEASQDLIDECHELHRNEKTGAFRGRKDILMAYGMIGTRLRDNPWLKKKEVKQSEHVINGRKIIEAIIRKQRRESRYR